MSNERSAVLLGWFLGVCVMAFIAYNFIPLPPEVVKRCDTLCAELDGVRFYYDDGKCDCKNGASFEEE